MVNGLRREVALELDALQTPEGAQDAAAVLERLAVVTFRLRDAFASLVAVAAKWVGLPVSVLC